MHGRTHSTCFLLDSFYGEEIKNAALSAATEEKQQQQQQHVIVSLGSGGEVWLFVGSNGPAESGVRTAIGRFDAP